MTTAYVVTLHNGGGSMVEASCAEHALGLFATSTTADAVANRLQGDVIHAGLPSWVAGELWTMTQEVSLPNVATVTDPSQAELDAEVKRILAALASEWEE